MFREIRAPENNPFHQVPILNLMEIPAAPLEVHHPADQVVQFPGAAADPKTADQIIHHPNHPGHLINQKDGNNQGASS